MLYLGIDNLFELPDVRADLFQHRPHDPAVFLKQGGQQMNRLDLRIPRLRGQLLRASNGFLGFDR